MRKLELACLVTGDGLLCPFHMLLSLVELSELSDWHNTEQMTWSGIGRVDQADLDGVTLIGRQLQVADGKAFTRSQADVHFMPVGALLNLDRAAKCREGLLTGHHGVTHHQLMGTVAGEVEGHVKPDAVGADVIEG